MSKNSTFARILFGAHKRKREKERKRSSRCRRRRRRRPRGRATNDRGHQRTDNRKAREKQAEVQARRPGAGARRKQMVDQNLSGRKAERLKRLLQQNIP